MTRANVIANAEKHCPRRTPLLDDERPALILDTVQQLAEIRVGTQGGNHYRAILARGCEGGHKLSISII